jgi:hypothetical protein
MIHIVASVERCQKTTGLLHGMLVIVYVSRREQSYRDSSKTPA